MDFLLLLTNCFSPENKIENKIEEIAKICIFECCVFVSVTRILNSLHRIIVRFSFLLIVVIASCSRLCFIMTISSHF